MVQEIDLHTHSNFSDGKLSPIKLVERSCAMGIKTLAVLDHNTLSHIPEVLRAGSTMGIRVIPGVEISAVMEGQNLHLLAYGFDPANVFLRERLDYFKDFYHRRLREVAIIFRQEGIIFSADRTIDIAGRPPRKIHIAMSVFEIDENRRKLKEEGIATPRIFVERYLDRGMLAHMPKTRMSAEEAIFLTHQAGGRVFLAHPQSTLNGNFYKNIIPLVGDLHSLGMDGIEVFHPDNSREITGYLRNIVSSFKLLESAGSDFHGSYPPRLRLGGWQDFGLKPDLSWITL